MGGGGARTGATIGGGGGAATVVDPDACLWVDQRDDTDEPLGEDAFDSFSRRSFSLRAASRAAKPPLLTSMRGFSTSFFSPNMAACRSSTELLTLRFGVPVDGSPSSESKDPDIFTLLTLFLGCLG